MTSTDTVRSRIDGDEAVRRAASLREAIRARQDEAERLGHYTHDVHEAMLEAGLYHLLTPRRYGGHELSLEDWLRVVVEISRGDPGTGWCYCLGHSHNIQVASLFPQDVQERAFAGGYLRASHSLAPAGTATPVDGGYRLTGVSRYQSGSPYSTHAIVLVQVDDEHGQRPMQALLPMDQCTLLDDWGGDKVLGMRASGSNSVRFDDVVVPASQLVPPTWAGEVPAARTGAAIHGNPMYIGSVQTFLGAELAAIVVGTARAALDEWEELSRSRKAPLPPFVTRDLDPSSQQLYGTAQSKADAAEAILLHAARTIEAWSEAFVDGEPLTRAMDTRLNGAVIEAGRLAAEAVETLAGSAGSSEARPGRRMERYVRDVFMYRTHAAVQHGAWMRGVGATALGHQASAFDLPQVHA